MSNKGAVRALRLPPADFNALKIPGTRQPARHWFRVQQSVHAGLQFGLKPFHRFSHQACPWPILYLAASIDTCLFERFGDEVYDRQKAIPHSLWDAYCVCTVKVPELQVCDLARTKTLTSMRADLSALMHNDLAAPQEWGLVLQKHPANFQAIKYRSRFNGKACLALFPRADIQRHLHEDRREPLSKNDPAVAWLDKHEVSLY